MRQTLKSIHYDTDTGEVVGLLPDGVTEVTIWPGFEAGGDLTGTTTSQQVVAATGATGTLPLATTAATVQWATATTTPKLKQADVATNSATGADLTVQAQNATGTTATGGRLFLTSGTGTTAAGEVRIQCGGTTKLTLVPTQATGDILKSNGSSLNLFNRGTALQVLRVNSGGTDIEWATASSGLTVAGSANELQTNSGSSTLAAATNVLGGSGFLSIGTTPATTGSLRLPAATASLITVRNSINNANLVAVGIGGSDNLFIGCDSGIANALTSVSINPTTALYLGTTSAYYAKLESSTIKTLQPMGGSAGDTVPLRLKTTSVNVAGSSTHTASAAEYACPVIYNSGAGGGGLVLPDLDGAAFIIINPAGTGAVSVHKSGGSGCSVPGGSSAWVVHVNGDYALVQ